MADQHKQAPKDHETLDEDDTGVIVAGPEAHEREGRGTDPSGSGQSAKDARDKATSR
ncbi:hypothetical protein [Ensifer soli]|uniref:hypothetical protein n=1 Tax=Ciceribacter sp. sgz301302 TaxID=3342379 RepID=UPI0035BB8ECB